MRDPAVPTGHNIKRRGFLTVGNVRGFAFVEMESEVNEGKAIQALDGAEWMERDIKVDKARPRGEKKNLCGLSP